MAVKAWPIIPFVAHTSGLMSASITRRQLGMFPGARRTIVPISSIMSLLNKGVGLSGMIKKEWENIKSPHKQSKGCEKYLVTGLPMTPWTVTCRLERAPGLERRTEKVAPVSKRKWIDFPSTSGVTQGSGAPMMRWDEGATVRSPGPLQSRVGVWVGVASLRGRGLRGQSDFQ